MNNWIICIGGSDEDGVIAYYFTGTKDEVKELLARKVKALIREETSEEAEYFTESADDVEERPCSLYAFVSFENYHVDIEAIRAEEVRTAQW